MKKMRLAAMLLAALTALGGCSAQIEERPLEDVSGVQIAPGADAPEQDAYVPHSEYVTLYFLGEDGTTLVPVVRSVEVSDGMSTAQAAYSALMAGPLEGEKGVMWPDMGTGIPKALEISDGIATADLPARARSLPQEQLYAVRQAVANTLTGFVAYANVLIGGREEGFDLGATLPLGTLSHVNDPDAGAQYARLDEIRQNAAGISRMTTLYFPSGDGTMVLPEVRSITYDEIAPIEYVYTILDELGMGSTKALRCRDFPAPLEYLEAMPEIVRTQDGAYRAIVIRFGSQLDEALELCSLTRGVYMAMLTHTLMGFVPGVEGLQVSIGGQLLTGLEAEQTPDGQQMQFRDTLATRADFTAYVGAPCTLYVRRGEGLQAVRCVIEQGRQRDPRARLECLMGDSGEGTLPPQLGAQDILAVSVREGDILLNLSAQAGRALSALGAGQARTAVYAVVNTLTEGVGRQDVRFFFEGAQDVQLEGIEMRGKLTRNPGMVVE